MSAEAPAVSGRPRLRGAFLAITAVMYALVVRGFWPYWRAPLAAPSPRPWVVHLHAAVFTGWMLLLLAQVLLVWRGRRDLHQRLGRLGIGYGVLVLLMGLTVTTVAPVVHLARGEWTLDEAAGFLILPLGDMALFGTLFALAVRNRRHPDVHKRYMLCATVALMFAPVARLAGAAGPLALLAVWLLPLALGAGADWWSRGRVHRSYGVGALILLVGFTRLFVMETPGWLAVGRGIVRALGPVASFFPTPGG